MHDLRRYAEAAKVRTSCVIDMYVPTVAYWLKTASSTIGIFLVCACRQQDC